MEPSADQLDRILLRPQFVLHYRRASRVRWTNTALGHYVLLFPSGGCLSYKIDGRYGELKTRAALLLNPGATATVSGRNSELLSFSLAPAFLFDCAARMRLVQDGSTILFRTEVVEHDDRLSRIAGDLQAELLHVEAGQVLAVEALVEQIVIHLLRRHANMRRSPELELSRVGLVDRRVRRALELMDANLDRDLSLSEISRAAHLSPFHFARLFKKLTGATPHAYLGTLRTARARQLLAETDLSVIEIGGRVGYLSPSHFAKAFKQATGLSPRAFRAAIIVRA
jgi:AraC family transcriptional regulator